MSRLSNIARMVGFGAVASLLAVTAISSTIHAQPLTLATLPPGAINNLQSTVLAAAIQENS
ncbi:MAG: hypothetical protein O7A03_09505, partial [Alphaproteobacteria bacterium]|nr:hypothetical protein [Alphaproteobacteria bacterium]